MSRRHGIGGGSKALEIHRHCSERSYDDAISTTHILRRISKHERVRYLIGICMQAVQVNKHIKENKGRNCYLGEATRMTSSQAGVKAVMTRGHNL